MTVGSRATLVRVAREPGREVALADASTGGEIAVYGVGGRRVQGRSLTSHVYVCDGRSTLVAGLDSDVVRQWDLASGTRLHRDFSHSRALFWRRHHKADVTAIASYSDDARVVLLVAGRDGVVRSVDAESGRDVATPLTHDAPIQAVGVCVVDGVRYVVCGDWNGWLWRWRADTAERVGPGIRAHLSVVKFIVSYEVDGRVFWATASSDQSVQRWDAATGERIGELLCDDDTPMGVSVVRSGGSVFLIVAYGNFVQWYDAVSGQPVRVALDLGEQECILASCTMEVDGRTALFVAGEAAVWRFDAVSGEPWPADRP